MERIFPLAAEYDMLPQGTPLLCALSGGGDSVALVHFLKSRGYPVLAAHFNHQLRPTAGRDAAFARRFCAALGVPFYYGEGDVAAQGGNLEAAARRLRYRFLIDTAAQTGAGRVLTAHTANDNLETVLLHLTRGAGLRGLVGIRPRQGTLCRPMLHTTRAAVDAYLAQNGLEYMTDETNLDDRFARNRIRHQVVPVLETLNPRVAEAAARMTDRLRADESFLTAQALAAARRGEAPLPPALACRVPPAPVPPVPVLVPQPLPLGLPVDTPLWRLTATPVPAAPDTPPTPCRFYLQGRWAKEALTLRPRQPGDFLHPPFRTGKTLKKWMNELAFPPAHRAAVPVLAAGGVLLAAAGIGPAQGALAAPGEPALLIECEKREEDRNVHG